MLSVTIPSRVILSHPYAGAGYGWFSQFNPHRPSSKLEVPSHPYYKYLYGTDFPQWIDVALTLMLLYEEIVLPPADAYLPRPNGIAQSNTYRNDHLGIESDWEILWEVLPHFREQAYSAIQRPEICDLLQHAPANAQLQIIESCYIDAFLSETLACPIICGSQRRELLQRLYSSTQKDDLQAVLPSFAEAYVQFSGLTFKASDVEELYRLKENAMLRQYSVSFRRMIHGGVEMEMNEVAAAIREAMGSRDLREFIAGFLAGATRTTTYLGCIPGMGFMGIGVQALQDLTARPLKRSEWYQFTPQVRALQAEKLLEDQINAFLDEEIRAIEIRQFS
jgi:hypothetical protein